MGDFGPGLYVPESLLPIYRDCIIPISDVCLPNQFEAELLTGAKISSERGALAAMHHLHSLGADTVILSSVEIGDDLLALASTSSDPKRAFRIRIPRVPAAFVGTGDLFTALCTAWLRLDKGDLGSTLERTIASMQAVLRRTLSHAEKAAKETGREKPHPFQMELKLIQSKADIEQPQVKVKAEVIKVDQAN